jgi:glycerophosphoryl diester phosphodiesterase
VYQDRHFHFGKPKIPEGINTVVMHYKFLNPSFIQAMHARNIGVATYTVNETEDMKKVLNLGVDAVITDYPDRLYAIVNSVLR